MARPADFPSLSPSRTGSGRKPSVAPSQPDYLSLPGRSTDCRTRSNDYQQAIRKHASSYRGTTLGRPGGGHEITPASIFEHRRLISSAAEGGTDRTTDVRYPSSFDEIEQWLEGHVEHALAAAAAAAATDHSQSDLSSAINVLFLDEKKCAKVFNQDFALNRLLPKLKITGWCTSHYMSTYCRYPIPLDPDCDGKAVQPVWNWRYCLNHPFDWDLLWAYFPTTRTTVAIVRTWFDGYDTNFTQLENEITDFEGPTLAHPMLFGLLALEVLTSDAMGNVREKGNVIYEAQTLTGFHQYSRLRATDSDGRTIAFDLGGVSRKVIGAASHLTGWENATVQMAKFARFAQAENKRYMETGFAAEGESGRVIERLCVYIDEESEKLIGDIDGAYHDSRAWLSTANFLLMGVLNVLGQDDSRVNIELAKDQKRIAEETKRDSTSMTAIAVVTMFFLPGTFTASFFALPYFEADIERYGFTHFWIYWAVTVPLTILTLVAWTFYTKVLNPAAIPRDKSGEDADIDEMDRRQRNVSITEWIAKMRSKAEVGHDV
ncbi:hypothetical protein MFIFM68171_07077 [Madurella fahalii]|uniref:Uncharacterized protein n=1 Tax=Madurella fahalii TaxID=1157608 RepID=A0ABQ0GGG8_9PEZI